MRARNNLFWHAIFDHYESVAEFCRIKGMDNGRIGNYLNLNGYRPYNRSADLATGVVAPSDLTDTARRLCEATGISANELFPISLYSSEASLRLTAEVDSKQFVALSAARRLALPPTQEDEQLRDETAAVIREVLKTLTPREEEIITVRFGLSDGREHTCDEVAAMTGVTKERIRQIEAKALMKLRHPSRMTRLISGCSR